MTLEKPYSFWLNRFVNFQRMCQNLSYFDVFVHDQTFRFSDFRRGAWAVQIWICTSSLFERYIQFRRMRQIGRRQKKDGISQTSKVNYSSCQYLSIPLLIFGKVMPKDDLTARSFSKRKMILNFKLANESSKIQ